MKLTRYLSSPTFLLLVVIWLAIIGLTVSLSSCQKKSDTAESVTPVDNLAPKITKMHIPGIPAENIKIDQVKRLLIVTLPDGFTVGYSTNVSLTMTPGTTLFRIAKVGVNLCYGSFNDVAFVGVSADDLQYDNRELIINDGPNQKVYRLQIKPEADMFFSAANKVYQSKSDGKGETFDDVVIHNYRDTSHSSKAIYRNLKTGNEYSLTYNECVLTGRNLLSSGFGQLPLGEYSVQIQKSNGRRTTNSLRMILTAGKAEFNGFSHAISKGRSGTIAGRSLFDGNFKAIEIWPKKTDEKYTIDILTYNPTGASVGVQFPANLPTGAYWSQLVYHDGQRSELQSGHVLELKYSLF
jgi:hypothetical protein